MSAGRGRFRGSPVRFHAAPLDMIVNNGATGAKHLIETMIAGVAVFDYDADGWPDIFIANGAAIPSLEKTGPHSSTGCSGTTTTALLQTLRKRPASLAPVIPWEWRRPITTMTVMWICSSLAFGETRCIETAATALSKTLRRWLDLAERTWAVAAGWFDYDNDGRLDLFVVRYVQWDPATETVCGFPEKGIRQYCNPKLYAAARKRPLSQ